MAVVTCRTDGCGCAGKAVDLDITVTDADTGITSQVDAVFCGACAQQISDITDV